MSQLIKTLSHASEWCSRRHLGRYREPHCVNRIGRNFGCIIRINSQSHWSGIRLLAYAWHMNVATCDPVLCQRGEMSSLSRVANSGAL